MIVVLAALAVYRAARMLALEEGPLALFDRWRDLFQADNWLGRGVRCPLCVGFWLALPVSLGVLWIDATLPPLAWPLAWLGIAGAAAALQQVTE